MKKVLSFLMVLVLSFSGFGQAKAAAAPKLQIVSQPNKEYKNGDTIAFKVTNPNYSGKVEYRVILYNGTTKKTTNLWNTSKTGYFYRGWQPAGNYTFEIHWPVSQMDPGAYSMTVLVRKANSTSKYDSFIDTSSFYVVDNTSNADPKFIGDGTEKRVSIIDAKYSFQYDRKALAANKTLYYAKSKFFNETATNSTIDDNIKYISNLETVAHIYIGDKDYTMLLGGTSLIKNTKDTLAELRGVRDGITIFDDKPHNFEVYLYEVFYSRTENKYYLANENHTEILGGIAKEVPNTKGEIPKYVAIPVMIADF